ncbi:unnamed protein product [Caenorhabditis sp. 36 PRJEB53466]|nr:unnamed protein product [Caenorhabditis sp. 36 PRJEB53466]
MTAKQCAEKMKSFKSKEEYMTAIPSEEIQRFTSKAILGRKGHPLKCFNCERVYASATGFLSHLRKCDIKTTEEIDADALMYRATPSSWLKIEKKDQKAVLEKIVGKNYECFSPGCSKKCTSLQSLIDHLDTAVRDGLKLGSLPCLVCGRLYSHHFGLIYHVERCQLKASEQPWKCWRCGFEAKAIDKSAHLAECTRVAAEAVEKKVESLLLEPRLEEEQPSAKRRRQNGAPRATSRKDGSILYRYRKSTVTREFNGLVTIRDQQKYEQACSSVYDSWKDASAEVAFCDRLAQIQKSELETTALEEANQFHGILTRQSVTLLSRKLEGLQESVPSGVRVNARESTTISNDQNVKTTVAFCGAPINAVKVAPGQTLNGDDVICVSTFANETNLESDSSLVQFWRHRVDKNRSELELWFLLYLPNRGTVLSMTWLQKYSAPEEGLIGFAAFSTTRGEVLIYRIDSPSVTPKSNGLQVVVLEPHLILKLQKRNDKQQHTNLKSTIKTEGDSDEPALPEIDESVVPIIKISWCAQDGGKSLVGISALGEVILWDLNGDLENPVHKVDEEWQSPPSDIAFLNSKHIVVSFREKLIKVLNLDDWGVKLEENTMKTAGSRVHTDARIVSSFFTFQSEYTGFPYPNATSVAYINMEVDSPFLVLIPTGNTHQLMTWDVAINPATGTLMSSGVDGRLFASASGRLLKEGKLPFFANRSLMTLKKRYVHNDPKTVAELLNSVKTEENASESSKLNEKRKEPLEESILMHDDVCKKMWLEVVFDEPFEPGRPELSCRDQRIESLNCVDTNTNKKFPVAFVGGEAGLLFAVSSNLIIQELDL